MEFELSNACRYSERTTESIGQARIYARRKRLPGIYQKFLINTLYVIGNGNENKRRMFQ